jgi:MFS family permease
MSANLTLSVPPPPKQPPLYTAGTLTYTRLALGMLFFWLLWGFFIYTLMEVLIPSLLPLLLRREQATNTEISFITTSLNLIGNMIFNPIVSFASDRHRGRWGRRKPFIAWSTPAVVVCLAAIPFGSEIAGFLSTVPFVRDALAFSPLAPSILVVAVFVMGFQIFDTFIGAVYYYLVRDTVPEQFIGRFFASFRLVGAPAQLLYNLYIFPYGEDHMRVIFVVIAIGYGIGIFLMCWRVKEGRFPPPDPLPGNDATLWGRLVGSVQIYLQDCFRSRVYWASFLASSMSGWAIAANVFALLFHREQLGLSMTDLGRIGAVVSAVSFVIVMPIGYLVDKWNIFRLAQLSFVARVGFGLWCYFFVQDFNTLLIGSVLLLLPNTSVGLCNAKIAVVVWPKAKYGQFGSANSAFNSMIVVVIAPLAGAFIDYMGDYRSYLIWFTVLSIPPAFCFLWLEYEWRRRGGKEGYTPP